MQDIVYRLTRTRHFSMPGRKDASFEIDVWTLIEEATMAELNKLAVETSPDHLVMTLDHHTAMAIIANMYELSPEKKLPRTSSVWRKGKFIFASYEIPFIDAGNEEAERSARILGEFIVDGSEVDDYPPEEGFRVVSKLLFRKENGDDPMRTEKSEFGDYHHRKYRRRRWGGGDDFIFHFVRYKAGHDYTKITKERPRPVLKHHLMSLLRRITTELPGEVKMYDRWDVKDITNKIATYIADYVRLYGKNAYRDSGAFLVVLDHYLKCKKVTRNKLQDDFCDWLDAESKSRVVRKLLKAANIKHGKGWTVTAPNAYADAVTRNPEPNPISEAHNEVVRKLHEEQHQKLKAQRRNLQRREARARARAIKEGRAQEAPDEDTRAFLSQIGEARSAGRDNAAAAAKRARASSSRAG